MEEAYVNSSVGGSPQYLISLARGKIPNTRIGNINHDAAGKKLTLSARQRMIRLKSWDKRVTKQFSEDRKKARALAELNRLADKLNIQRSIREEAARIYCKAKNENMLRGTPIVVAVPAALYAACRVVGNPRTLREILKESLASTKVARMRVARFYRRLITELKLQPCRSDPITYVSKVAESMRISGRTQGLAIQILKDAKEKHLGTGKNPSGFVAAALYIAGLLNNEKRKQKEISKVAGVADATVRHHCRSLRKRLNLQRAWREEELTASTRGMSGGDVCDAK
jgi:transcription initiation factor TFIIB